MNEPQDLSIPVTKEPVHLVCASNASFNMPLCVMLTSVVDHFDPQRDLAIHIISNDSGAQEKENVEKSLRAVRPSLDHVEINWHTVDASVVGKMPSLKGTHISQDTYARFFIPYLVPESCDRVIYLDCDLVALADISKLYDSTLASPATIHAANELKTPFVSSKGGMFDYAERGIPADTRYFNAGVLVINLKRWREQNLTPRILDYLENEPRNLWFDQGALNSFLHDDWAPLDLRWNQTYVFEEKFWTHAGYTQEDLQRTLNDPYIVHYIGPDKPWMAGRPYLPRRAYFFHYLQKTPFKNTVPKYPYLESLLGFRIYYRLWRFGINLVPGDLRLRLREKRRKLVEKQAQ